MLITRGCICLLYTSENKKFPHAVLNQAETEAKELEKVHDDDMESIITDGRYNYIQKLVASTVKKAKGQLTVSDLSLIHIY